MRDALKLIESNRIYKKIFKEVYKKYKGYGKITGSFTLKPKNEEERRVLSNFDPSVLYKDSAKIKCREVEKLFIKRFNDIVFSELLEKAVCEELKTNKEIKEDKAEKLEEFFKDIIDLSKEGQGLKWFKELRNSKKYGYNTLIRKYNESLENRDEIVKKVSLVIDALNNLPYINSTYKNIAVFSAEVSRNPHFLDFDTFTGGLFKSALEFIFSKENVKAIGEINELYYEAGILKDELSNHCTMFSLNAFDFQEREIEAIKEFNNWGEPLEISISNLSKVKFFRVIDDVVYVFENPAVFHEVLKRCKRPVSLICTSGQLNLSSYMLLDKIKDLNVIYYSGDFDPEGLLIADRIKRRYKDRVKFMFYNEKVYKEILSGNIISDSRLASFEKLQDKELKDLAEVIKVEKKAGYEEVLIEKYLDMVL